MENTNKNSKQPYKSVEEGKAHYSRLAAQNSWISEDEVASLLVEAKTDESLKNEKVIEESEEQNKQVE